MVELKRIVAKKKKRVGRGYGSGKGGHTVGRGQKGQKSRGGLFILFEGTKVKKSLIKRLPLLRGKGKNEAKIKPTLVNLSRLAKLEEGSEVDLELLIKKGIVGDEARTRGVKILGGGSLKSKLIVKLPVSKGAGEKITKAGGTSNVPDGSIL